MTQPILNLRPGSAPAMVDKKRGRGRRARQLPPPTMLEACALPARHKRYIYFLHVHRTMDEEERLRTMYTDRHGNDLDLTIGRNGSFGRLRPPLVLRQEIVRPHLPEIKPLLKVF